MENVLGNLADRLPRRSAVAFAELLEKQQLDSATLSKISDASELSGDYPKVLGFAVGYLFMKQSGVPIDDVLAMAKLHGRRVRLNWSAKRWEIEHQRLSQLSTLKQLEKDNVDYDLSLFELALDLAASRFLLRTSRRLGLEGIRQRSCVASYHDRVQSGSCAIASVVHHGRRWTVELVLNNDPSHPVRLTQIKSRLNRTPTVEETQAIHRMFGIQWQPPKEIQADVPADERLWLRNLLRICPILHQHGVEKVLIDFEGGGDSGAVEGVTFTPKVDGRAIEVQVLREERHFSDGEWTRVVREVVVSAEEAIEQAAEEYLDVIPVEWVNNEGGYGNLVLNVHEATFASNVWVRFEEAHHALDRTYDLRRGELVEEHA